MKPTKHTYILMTLTAAIAWLAARPTTAGSDVAERQVRELRRIADALERGCR